MSIRLSLIPLLLLSACSTVKHEIAESSARDMEYQLHAAGFKVLLADSNEKQALLKNLPEGRLSRYPAGPEVFYMYPDPVVCSCLYVGRETEFRNLQKLAMDLGRSNQALIAHEISESQQAQWAPSGAFGNMGYWGITNPNSMGRPAYDPE